MVQDYSLAVNSYTKNLIDGLIPKRIIPFDFYEERDIDRDVRDWIQDGGRDFAVILGDAGMGKTNLLCKLADELIKGGQFAVFFVKSENLIDERFDENILNNLDLKGPGLNLTSVLEVISAAGRRIIFLLDTLDVIAIDKGIVRLEQFLTTFRKDGRIVLGTSRPLEYRKIENLANKTFELKPFSDTEVGRLFDKYKAYYQMTGVELRQPILEVCRNPLHMRMLFEVYQPNEIPEDISTQLLYDRYWQRKVGEIRQGALSHLDAGKKNAATDLKEKLAKRIATEMFTSGKITLEIARLDSIMGELAGKRLSIRQVAVVEGSRNVKVDQSVKDITIESSTLVNDAWMDLRDEGVLREQNKRIEFFHQSFFEYATGRSIIEEDKRKREIWIKRLLDDITSLENRAIIQQVILQARIREEQEIAQRFLERLSRHDTYTKMLAIDLLRRIGNLTEKEIEIYQSLTNDIKINRYLAESLRWIILKHPGLALGLMETLSKDRRKAVRSVAAEALAEFAELYPQRARFLVEELKGVENIEIQKAIEGILRKGRCQ